MVAFAESFRNPVLHESVILFPRDASALHGLAFQKGGDQVSFRVQKTSVQHAFFGILVDAKKVIDLDGTPVLQLHFFRQAAIYVNVLAIYGTSCQVADVVNSNNSLGNEINVEDFAKALAFLLRLGKSGNPKNRTGRHYLVCVSNCS